MCMYSSETTEDIVICNTGIQFLPLDKYMYLKAHCFVNLIETTFRLVCGVCQPIQLPLYTLLSQDHSTHCISLWRSASMVRPQYDTARNESGISAGVDWVKKIYRFSTSTC